MEENDLRDLESIFAQVEDPRMDRTRLHRLRDIIILAICGVLCGAEGWVEIEEFGKAKEAFFTDLLDLPNGIPSHDTFGRVFALIDPKQFARKFHPMGARDQPKSPRSDRDRWQNAAPLTRSSSRQKSAASGKSMGGRKSPSASSTCHRRKVE